MKKIFTRARAYFAIIWMILTPFAMGIWMLFHFRGNLTNANHAFVRFLRWGVQKTGRVEIEVEGREHLTAHQPCIFVSNHQHYFDAVIVGEVFPPHTVVAAMIELRRLPVMGWIFEKAGNIFIDRDNPKDAIRTLRNFAEKMRREKVNLWIFPEGYLNEEKRGLQPFKRGPFLTAVQLQAPLVPVVMSPSYCMLDATSGHRRSGKAWVKVLPPIATAGLTRKDIDALRTETREKMLAAYQELEQKALLHNPPNVINCDAAHPKAASMATS
jgi:1-acyl-sn-glycerol-3-phosphate acyltransferase